MRYNPSDIAENWLLELLPRYESAIDHAGRPFVEDTSARLLSQMQGRATQLQARLRPYGIEDGMENEALVAMLMVSLLRPVSTRHAMVRNYLPYHYAVLAEDPQAAADFDRFIRQLQQTVARDLHPRQDDATNDMFDRLDRDVVDDLQFRAHEADPHANLAEIEDALFDAFWRHLRLSLRRELTDSACAMLESSGVEDFEGDVCRYEIEEEVEPESDELADETRAQDYEDYAQAHARALYEQALEEQA